MTEGKQRRGESNECKLFRSETKENRKSLLLTLATCRQHRVTQMLRRRCQISGIFWRTIRNTWTQWVRSICFQPRMAAIAICFYARKEPQESEEPRMPMVKVSVADSESVIFKTYVDTRTFFLHFSHCNFSECAQLFACGNVVKKPHQPQPDMNGPNVSIGTFEWKLIQLNSII